MFEIATEPSAFLTWVSFGLYTSIVPQLIVSKVCNSFYNATVCSELSTGTHKWEERHVYEQATKWNSICFAAIGIPSLFTVMIVGALSDVVSKKKLLLLPPVLLSIQNVVLMLSAKFMSSSMVFVVLAVGLTSIYGGYQGCEMLAYSYMADVTEADQVRTVRMSVLGGLMFVAFGLSSFACGVLLKKYGFISVFSLGLATSLTHLVFVVFMLPEISNQASNDNNLKTFGNSVSSSLAYFRDACVRIKVFSKKYLFSWKNKHVGLLLIACLFARAALIGETVIIVLFLKHRPLALSPDKIGEFILALQLSSGLGVVVLVVVSLNLFKPSDLFIVVTGHISSMSTFLAIGLLQDSRAIFGVTPLALGYSLPSSGIKSMITKLVQPDEVSTALSCLGLVNVVSLVLITFSCNELFRFTATFFPGMSVVLLAISSLIALLLTITASLCYCKDESNTLDIPFDIIKSEYEIID